MELVYWHWIVLGIVLMLAEIFIGSFFIFWFGAAAVVVGLSVLSQRSNTAAAETVHQLDSQPSDEAMAA